MTKFDYLIVDIGSTYTKQRLFKNKQLVASVQSPTTIEDVQMGIDQGDKEIKASLGMQEYEVESVLASSSAAGGLKMVAMGYMSRVTAKAAKEVAMNSGAKILEIISHEDPPEYRIQIIKETDPDIVLLAGGTDFGDETSLVENAELLARCDTKAVVVIAGNIMAQKKAEQILQGANISCVRAANIMPTIHQLKVEEARDIIHKEFIKQITKARGLSALKNKITNEKIVPTPGAVLMATELLAKGTYEKEGLGEVIIVDLGGATTDVHSVIPRLSELKDEEIGLIISNEKQISHRTVEGNLGLRVSALGVLETVNPKAILKKRGLDLDNNLDLFIGYCQHLDEKPMHLPKNQVEYEFDTLLAETAVEVALKRHAGYISTNYDPITGITPGMPVGRDLRNVETLIAVGGIFAHRSKEEGERIIRNALKERGVSLLPKDPKILIDANYLLYTGGIISQVDEEYAFDVLINQFKNNRG
ncbi:glutamate mutase L [Alkalicella caledoniensis]|uniref:Glutamate mutase L n=1 Tax=Alkalicella caledoniensis TaxID=2731377 RepID=A0A7G9WB35_ALKCA|nr:glutamate mutase L [Alkalicella caledoniensis]QNO15897.1 glutamate mutase L [Alkalicella caledoniensis]